MQALACLNNGETSFSIEACEALGPGGPALTYTLQEQPFRPVAQRVRVWLQNQTDWVQSTAWPFVSWDLRILFLNFLSEKQDNYCTYF